MSYVQIVGLSKLGRGWGLCCCVSCMPWPRQKAWVQLKQQPTIFQDHLWDLHISMLANLFILQNKAVSCKQPTGRGLRPDLMCDQCWGMPSVWFTSASKPYRNRETSLFLSFLAFSPILTTASLYLYTHTTLVYLRCFCCMNEVTQLILMLPGLRP